MKKRLWPFCFVLPLLLSGCKKIDKHLKMPSTRVRKIAHLDATTNDFEVTREGITIRSRTITNAQECTKLFGVNGKDLLTKRKKIYPVQITIENKTNKPLVLPRENVGLKTASIRRVLKRIGYWTGTRTALTAGCFLGGVTILAWASSPLAFLFFLYGEYAIIANAVMIAGAPFALVSGVLLVSMPLVTILHSFKSHNANHMISKFVKKTNIKKQVTIEPGQTHSLLFFVRPRLYKRSFSMVFKQGDENSSILFDVQTVSLKTKHKQHTNPIPTKQSSAINNASNEKTEAKKTPTIDKKKPETKSHDKQGPEKPAKTRLPQKKETPKHKAITTKKSEISDRPLLSWHHSKDNNPRECIKPVMHKNRLRSSKKDLLKDRKADRNKPIV